MLLAELQPHTANSRWMGEECRAARSQHTQAAQLRSRARSSGEASRGAHSPLRVRTQVQRYKGALIPTKLNRLRSKRVIKAKQRGTTPQQRLSDSPRAPGLPPRAEFRCTEPAARVRASHLEIRQHRALRTSSAAPVTKRGVAYRAAVTLRSFPTETEKRISHRSSRARRLTTAPEAAARGGAPGQLPAARTAPYRTRPRSARRRAAAAQGHSGGEPPARRAGPSAGSGHRGSAPALPAARPRPAAARSRTQLAAGLLQLLDLVLQKEHGHPEHQHGQQLQLGRQHDPEQPHRQPRRRRPPGITT